MKRLVARCFGSMLVAVASSVTACAPMNVASMHPVEPSTPPAAASSPGTANVVFVWPPNACDERDYVVVVDENGHWLGNIAPNARFSAPLPAGEHALFAWPHGELRSQKYPELSQVNAMRATLEAGKTYYVGVSFGGSMGTHKTNCGRWPYAHLFAIAPRNGDVWPSLQGWIDHARPLAKDDAAPADATDQQAVRLHVEKGTLRLPPTGAPGGERTLVADDGVAEPIR